MIIPSIDLKNGNAVQLVGGKELKVDAGDPRPICKKFSLVGEIAVVDLDAALGQGNNKDTIKDLLKIADCRVGGGIRDIDTALDWLNAGATKIVIGTAATPDFLSKLPKDRLVAALDAVNGEVVVNGWTTKTGRTVGDMIQELKPYVSGFLVTFVEREGRMGGVDISHIKQLKDLVGRDHELTIAGGVTTTQDLAEVDKLGVYAQVGMALYTNTLDLGDAFSAPLITDRPDGLYPTVVVDELGTSLGLVYSSLESIRESVKTGKGVYYSRSRNELWRKGDTSGNGQTLIRMELDCDRDALRFVVHQHGVGFCHLNRRSCFDCPDKGIGHLMRTLEARKANVVPGSYTQRLFNDPALLASKIIEEAHELVEAKTHEEVANEAADVLYFALVACVKAGVSFSDVERVLDQRSLRVSRRPGNAKPAYTVPAPSSTPATTSASSSKDVPSSSSTTTTPTPSPVAPAIVSPRRTLEPAAGHAPIKLGLPKGHMEKNIFKLLADAGIDLKVSARGYRPTISIPGFEVKLLKPQNIVEMLNLGSRDLGFTGSDLIAELGATDVTMLLDTHNDPIKVVAAAPDHLFDKEGVFVGLEKLHGSRKLVVASEYTHLTKAWMQKRGYTQDNAHYVHSRGATEVFPPEDADIIVDNSATGSTLSANRLKIIDEIFVSSTCLYAHSHLMEEGDPVRKQAIEKFVTLLKSVIDAHQRAILEFNIPESRLQELCRTLPAMRQPTISPLHDAHSLDQWFGVKIAVQKSVLFDLIPIIKAGGGEGIIVYDLKHVTL
eukprot:TRINITY_DN1563_c0_g1_i3.p1 TRINITY_DN1563_c0_g1~~TRINITY_DN1563_c0_g1_i3.p1  ORF type:complete len:778 (+),score=196.59 TRINITY_DN1563_c0_g1_i3:2791-5124(+)